MESNTQKIENSLNLAFSATEKELEKSPSLSVGYDEKLNIWEVIVKYSGEELSLDNNQYEVINLINEYAIVRGTRESIIELAQMPFVEYIEQPKNLFFERTIGELESGIIDFKENNGDTNGAGTIFGIVDSGIDYKNIEFRKQNGTTRILNIWDQELGVEYDQEEINQALLSESNIILPITVDYSGHGTEVTTIGAGNTGIASEAEIIVVKMGPVVAGGFPRTTELMRGISYLVEKAIAYGKPIGINISFGNTYGSHDGNSLLERFIDDISNLWKSVICIGSGNEGSTAGHTSGTLKEQEIKNIELLVDRRELAFDVQVWKYFEDEMDIGIVAPDGTKVGVMKNQLGVQRYRWDNTEILLYYGEPNPYSVLQEIYIQFIPINTYVNTGIWNIVLEGKKIVTGEYALWLPSAQILNTGTQFAKAQKTNTLTIPSTAQRVITVGAYNALTFTYAEFSGRGKTEIPRLVKPDVVAPGVRVDSVSVNNRPVKVTGTSYATPFVTGSALLLMEWGIVRGNDPYLYGEKVKAYLRKNARPIEGIEVYPNNQVGYGTLYLKSILSM